MTADEERDGLFQFVASEHYPRDVLGVVERLAPDLCLIDSMMMASISASHERGLRYAVINHLGWNPDGAAAAAPNGLAALSPAVPQGTTLFGLLERAPMVIATTYPELGAEPSRSPHVHFVGPIREPVEPAHWPRKWPERPFVLVSLSTINQQQEALLAKLCEALAPLELEVLITTGRGVKPESLPIAGGIQSRAFTPHDALLPQIDLTISHGGLGTTMYSLGAGVPVLAIAEGRDQADNARRMETLGLGKALHPSAEVAAIRAAVLDLLADRAMRDRCRAFASRISRFGDLGRAATLVEEFAVRAAA